MSADLLRRAAVLMREEAEAEAALRKGDPYYIGGEASRYERHWRPTVAVAVADWLEYEAQNAGEDYEGPYNEHAAVAADVARAYLGGTS